MSMIEERLDYIHRYDNQDVEHTRTYRRLISNWNAAADVLRRLIEYDYYTDTETSGIGWSCGHCGDGMNRQIGDHRPETCIVAAAQDVLAMMEGTGAEND